MSRPRTTEDIEAVRTRAAVRLERRRKAGNLETLYGSMRPAVWVRHLDLIREAAALVAALDALVDERAENMQAWAHGDR